MVTFQDFKKLAESIGYKEEETLRRGSFRHQYTKEEERTGRNQLYVLSTKNNGAKIELDMSSNKGGRCYIVGHNLSDEELEIAVERLEVNGFRVMKRGSCTRFELKDDILGGFAELEKVINGIEEIVATQRENGHRVKMLATPKPQLFLTIAKRYKHAVENDDWGMLARHRDMLEADAIDSIIEVGKSKKWKPSDGNRTTRREHVVPVIYLHHKLEEMARKRSSEKEMAALIEKYLLIVHISGEEQQKIDAKWQCVMPEGWQWGDSAFSRLDQAEIEWSTT